MLVVDELGCTENPSHSETFSPHIIATARVFAHHFVVEIIRKPNSNFNPTASGHGDDVRNGTGDERMKSKGLAAFQCASPKCSS